MTAILSLLLVVTLSILVTRVAAIALTYTGLSRQTARFQARSAFSGAGFTTSESEQVVNHPVRRRIVLMLMLLGNAGIVTAVSSLILAFVANKDGRVLALPYKILLLMTGPAILWGVASSRWVDRLLSRLIDRALRRFTRLDVSDYEGLLHLAGDYRIAEIGVEPHNWLDGRPLRELRPDDEGVLILGIVTTAGDWIGTPGGGATRRRITGIRWSSMGDPGTGDATRRRRARPPGGGRGPGACGRCGAQTCDVEQPRPIGAVVMGLIGTPALAAGCARPIAGVMSHRMPLSGCRRVFGQSGSLGSGVPLKRHRVTDGTSIQDNGSICQPDPGDQLRYGLVFPHVRGLDLSGDRITWSNRCFEAPIDLQEDRAWPWQILCHHGIQDCAGHSALHHDASESRGARQLLVIVQGVFVPADCCKQLDVKGRHHSCSPRVLADLRHASGPDLAG